MCRILSVLALLLVSLPYQLFAMDDRASAHGDSLSMLSNPQVQKELELMQAQQRELDELQAQFSKQLSEQMLELGQPGSTRGDYHAFQTRIRTAREEQYQKMKDVLLPHQLRRLNQVSLQLKMKSQGDVQALTDKELAQALGISDEQKKRLRKRAEAIRVELEDEIAELKQRARQKLLIELTPNQRRNLEEMLGAEFDHQPVKLQKRR